MITNNINQEPFLATPVCRSAMAARVLLERSLGHLPLSRYVVPATSRRERGKKRGSSRRGNICKWPAVVRSPIHIHPGIPTAADCSRVIRSCREVTRDSLDSSRSLRGLSLSPSKAPSPVYNQDPSPSSRTRASFVALSPAPSSPPLILLSPLARSRSFALGPSRRSHRVALPRQRPVVIVVVAAVVVVSWSSYRAPRYTRHHRGKRRGHLVVAPNYPSTTRISRLYPTSYHFRAAPFSFLRRSCAALPL